MGWFRTGELQARVAELESEIETLRAPAECVALPKSVRVHYKDQVESLDGILIHVDANHYVLEAAKLISVQPDGSPGGVKTVERQFSNPSIWVQRKDVLLVEVKR